jgi:hypothetical protein
MQGSFPLFSVIPTCSESLLKKDPGQASMTDSNYFKEAYRGFFLRLFLGHFYFGRIGHFHVGVTEKNYCIAQ